MPSLSVRHAEDHEPSPKSCGCSNQLAVANLRVPEEAVEATHEEIASVRNQLRMIEELLTTLFGETWSREPSSLKARRMAAELIEQHFDGIVTEWEQSVDQVFGNANVEKEKRRGNLHNSLLRFVDHLRRPDNLDNYI